MRGVGYVPRVARATCGSRRRTYLESHFGGLLNAGRTVGSRDPAMCRRCKWWLIPNTRTVVSNHLLFVILVETLLQELASASHFDSGWPPSPPFCGYRLNSRTTVFQTDNEGASPSARSAQPQQPFFGMAATRMLRPLLRADSPGGSPFATRCARVQLPLGSLSASDTSHDGARWSDARRITTGWLP